MLKFLKKVGNSMALFIEQKQLQEAGLDEKTPFQIIVTPNGIHIQSILPTNDEQFKKASEKAFKKYDKALRNLADK